jgi:hypothetical protein
MKKQIKKIVLAKETVRHLTVSETAIAFGGTFPNSDAKTCACPTAISCHPGLC